MKIKFFMIALLLVTLPVFSQGFGTVGYVNALGEKKTATVSDAVTVYVLTLGRNSLGFNADVAALVTMKILKDKKYDPNATLRRGFVSRMVARHLNLRDSLLYRIFGTERYAFRACVATRIMDSDGSEWDKISGEELLEIMSAVENRMEVMK